LNGEVAIRLVVAFVLTYVLGFERQLRGSPAGDRTFSLIGLGAAVVGVLAENGAPNALAGAVNGIGFIGGGLVFRQGHGNGEIVRGVTTAAGEGQLLTASLATALVLVSLELQHVPALRFLDARRWQPHFTQDTHPPKPPHPRNPPTNPKLRRACEARGSTLNDHLIVDGGCLGNGPTTLGFSSSWLMWWCR